MVVENKQKIVMVEMNSSIPNLGQMLAMPRFGITAIGSKLTDIGHDVTIHSESYQKTSLDDILAEDPSMVMFNGIRTAMPRTREMANQIRGASPDIPIIIGGEEATLTPEKVQSFADYIVLNEGDNTIGQLVDVIQEGGDLSEVKGIMYKEDGEWRKTKQANRVRNIDYKLHPEILRGTKDIGRKPLAKITGLTNNLKALSFPIQTTRGCKYSCNFCCQKDLFGKPGYVTRDIENIIEDMDAVIEHNGTNYFTVVDNLFGGNVKHGVEFFKKVSEHYSGESVKPKFAVLMRADQFGEKGFNDEEMHLMKEAGINKIFIGMESVNDETLDTINKRASVGKYIHATQRIHDYGIRVCGTFGAGCGEDTKEDVRAIGRFAKNNKIDAINMFAYTVMPGTKDYEKDKHRIIQNIPDKYWNGHGVTALPKKMLPSELQETINETMQGFYSWRNPMGAFLKLNLMKVNKSLKPHLKKLRELELDLIDREVYIKNERTGNYELNEDKIKNNPVDYIGKNK